MKNTARQQPISRPPKMINNRPPTIISSDCKKGSKKSPKLFRLGLYLFIELSSVLRKTAVYEIYQTLNSRLLVSTVSNNSDRSAAYDTE